MRFKCSTTTPDGLGLATLLERFANEQWLAENYTPEQAAEFVLDRFKRRIAAELEMVELMADLDNLLAVNVEKLT